MKSEFKKNPFEGKKVVFVQNSNDSLNADGERGHLEAVGDSVCPKSFYANVVKRILDVVVSFFAILILSPLFIVLMIAILIDDPGKIFFSQLRVGKNKKFFKIHKFRSMKMSTPKDVPTHMLENPDSYITKVGGFLRRHSLDELPQLFDIFVGNMSFVGPRPALWNQDVLVAKRDEHGANSIKPGLTGLAQINGRDELSLDEKAKLDGKYAERIGFITDIKCFFGTFRVFGGDESIVEGQSDLCDKKSILVVCQHYKPEPFRISDICEELVNIGYEVHVVTGLPNYPEGEIYPGYEKGRKDNEIVNGVHVHRVKIIPRKKGTLMRFLNYYSFARTSKRFVLSKKCVTTGGRKFDSVFCNQLSPVMMAGAGIAYGKKYGVKTTLYCLDLWPESLLAGGIKKNSFIYKHYLKVSKKIYSQADDVLVSSKSFIGYFSEKFGIVKNVEFLPQYAEELFENMPDVKKEGGFDFVFAGNVGKSQSVATIVNAAKMLSDTPVTFHIVGGGTELENVKKLAEGVGNVKIYGRKPTEEMPPFYAMADAMLVSLAKDEFLEMTLPGKIQSYMASGKPIIASADGETADTVKEAMCGLVSPAEDSEALCENVKRFVSDENARAEMAKNSAKYYADNYKKKQFFDRLILKL